MDEGVEVAGPAGTNLKDWTLELFSVVGKKGKIYKNNSPEWINLENPLPLRGEIDNEGGTGFGALWFDMKLPNKGRKGLALVDPRGTVLDFVSYKGR